jgi:hypothetical protein
MNIRPFDELVDYELESQLHDPTHFTVVGAADFVLGRVRRLLVDLDSNEVVYLVVNTRISNYQDDRGEERLVPLAWGELVRTRRQFVLPHLSRFGFKRLPIYQPEAIPEAIAFPPPNPEDPDLRDIA